MIWTLVITDGSYIEVFTFHWLGHPVIVDMLLKIDFDNKEAITTVLETLINKHSGKANDYQAASYEDAGKKYLFHLKCHGEKS